MGRPSPFRVLGLLLFVSSRLFDIIFVWLRFVRTHVRCYYCCYAQIIETIKTHFERVSKIQTDSSVFIVFLSGNLGQGRRSKVITHTHTPIQSVGWETCIQRTIGLPEDDVLSSVAFGNGRRKLENLLTIYETRRAFFFRRRTRCFSY